MYVYQCESVNDILKRPCFHRYTYTHEKKGQKNLSAYKGNLLSFLFWTQTLSRFQKNGRKEGSDANKETTITEDPLGYGLWEGRCWRLDGGHTGFHPQGADGGCVSVSYMSCCHCLNHIAYVNPSSDLKTSLNHYYWLIWPPEEHTETSKAGDIHWCLILADVIYQMRVFRKDKWKKRRATLKIHKLTCDRPVSIKYTTSPKIIWTLKFATHHC